MPRHSRLSLAGIPLHVIQRGNNRGRCFRDDDDKAFYAHHLGRLLPEAGCALHAYCLMDNHVHLLLTPDRAECASLLMKGLGQLHAQYFNRRHERTGTLWEGRFRSSLVQSQGYLLTCHRYIELNPVRAGMVVAPRDYPWSSHRGNSGEHEDPLLSPHVEFLQLGCDAGERAAVYRGLFGTLLAPAAVDEIRTAANAGYALGDAGFRAQAAQALGRRVERGRPGRPPRENGVRPRYSAYPKNVV
jgi:putative transposase